MPEKCVSIIVGRLCIVSFLFCSRSQTMDKLKLEAKFQMYRITVSTKFNGLTKELKDTFGLFEF